MLVHLSFLSPSLPLGLFSPTVQQDLAEPGAAAKQPLPRSAAMCQSAAGPLLHLHFALLRGRTGRGDPSALQVWVVRAYSGICFFFPDTRSQDCECCSNMGHINIVITESEVED